MDFMCLAHRVGEEGGVLFDTVREAYDHIKQRAAAEELPIGEYTITPIETDEL